jgi:hypothetical protein
VSVYQTSPIKRRRTKAELDELLYAVQRITGCGGTGIGPVDFVLRLRGQSEPITIRHLFYRLVGLHMIEKTEVEYRNLCHLLAKWRRSGAVPYDAFTDSTRWRYGPALFDDADAAMANTVKCYRKNLWASQPYYVEIWSEKDALTGALSQAAGTFGVETFSCHGFASLSSLNSAAQTFRDAQEAGKTVRVLHFGDHDPSGQLIDQTAKRTLAQDFKVEVEFKRVAVTPEQITSMDLPTRPVKKSNHAKNWEGGCVELDTIPLSKLRAMVEEEITSLINQHEWSVMRQIEREERETLEKVRRSAFG